MIDVAELNALDRDAFVATVGFAFEGSPWIARAAYGQRPFHSVADLHSVMVSVVKGAPRAAWLALILMHPDLGAGEPSALTEASRGEQASAGLNQLADDEVAQLRELNAAYRARFGFPFILCAREHTRASVVVELQRRLTNGEEAEIETALEEIAKIARLRLESVVR